jgi:transposase
MKTIRKIYDTAFKTKSVELSNERSNITELARELGIRVTMLYKWRKDYEKFGAGSFSSKGTLKQTPEQKNYNRVRSQIERSRART